MIAISEAKKVAERYLKKRNRKFTSLDNEEKISYFEDEELLYGMFEGSHKNVYVVRYGFLVADQERTAGIFVDASDGTVLYSISSHGWVEEIEDN